jgi:hypothetical protein
MKQMRANEIKLESNWDKNVVTETMRKQSLVLGEGSLQWKSIAESTNHPGTERRMVREYHSFTRRA